MKLLTYGFLLFAIGALGLCFQPTEKSDFKECIFGNESETRARFDSARNVILVRVLEDHWVDQGRRRYSLHVFDTKIVGTLKGASRVGSPLRLIHGVDSPARSETNQALGEIFFIFTEQNFESEVFLDAGEFLPYEGEVRKVSDYFFGRVNEIHI